MSHSELAIAEVDTPQTVFAASPNHIAPSQQDAIETATRTLQGCPHCSSLMSNVEMQFCSARSTSKWSIVRCQDCATMYTFPRPSEREMELSYPNDYFAYHVGRPRSSWSAKLRRAVQLSFAPNLGRKEHNAKRLRWNAAMSRIPILGRLFELGIFAPFGDRALVDIGCGAGHFLSKMRAIGWDVIGADRCEQAADRAMKSLGIPVVVGNFPEVDLPDESFDLVTAWQVLEHLDRPRPSLARMRRLLRPDGKLIITVPNQAGWGAKRFGADWIGNDLPRHLTHFSRQTLARMLEAEGFEILFLGAIPQSGWVRRSARQLETSRTSFTNSLLKHRLASTLYTTAAGFCGASETLLAIATSKIS